MVSRVVDEVARLTSRVESSGWSLGQVSSALHTLVALAPGGGQGGGLFRDGSLVQAPAIRPGITLALLDPNLRFKFGRTYDTVGDLSASQRLALDVERYAARLDIAMGVTRGAYLARLGPEGRTALQSIGAAALWQSARPPGAAAFIGIVAGTTIGPGVASLVSVVPSDGTGLPAVLPFAWGVYSTELRCFMTGGASGNLGAQSPTRIGVSPGRAVPTPRLVSDGEPPTVLSLTVEPAIVMLPAAATATVTLTAPAPPEGLTVLLETSDPEVAAVPSQVDVSAGELAAAFTVWPLKQGRVDVHARVDDASAVVATLEIEPA
jgi:hypothetical protein